MDEGSSIYGTVVKRTVMEDHTKNSGCRHSSGTIHYTKKPGGWTNVLLVSMVFVTVGGSAPVGYVCGISTNPYHVEDAWVRLPMSALRKLLLVGGVLGAIVAAALADWAGRRRTTIAGQLVGVVGASVHLAASLSRSQAVLVCAWPILGLFVGIGVCVLPMYLVELAPHPLKSSVGAVYTVGIALGLLLSQTLSLHCALVTGNGHPFLVPIFMLPIVISWFLLQHVPESPVFLYFMKKDAESAAVELGKLRGKDITSVETELTKDGEKGESQKSNSNIWRQSGLVILLCAAHLSQALSESDQLYHLSEARPRLTEPDVIAVGYTASVISCVVALMLVHLVSVVSWHTLLITSCVNSSVLLLVMASFAMQEDANGKVIYMMLVTLLVQVIAFDIGLRPIPCFLACELFNAKTTSTMMAVGAVTNFLGQLLSDQMFLVLGVAHFRVIASVFLAIFVVMLLLFLSTEGKGPVTQKNEASPKIRSAVSHLPNP